MITSKQNSEDQITTMEIENEVKSTKSEKERASSPVKIDGNPKGQDNTKEIVLNIENHQDGRNKNAISPANKKTTAKRVPKNGREGDKSGMFKSDLWVAFGKVAGPPLPEGETGLHYEPGRNKFIVKTFTIVFVMLLVTAMTVAVCQVDDEMKAMVRQYGIANLIVGFIGVLAVNFTMVCTSWGRRVPCNIILLVLGLNFMCMIATYITVKYDTDVLLNAFLATLVTVTICMILACTKFDFTSYMLYVIGISAALFALSLIVFLTSKTTGTPLKPLKTVILVLVTIVNVVVLIIELQMILGGKTVELSEDDYALGAFMVYTSIINIFLNFVKLLG